MLKELTAFPNRKQVYAWTLYDGANSAFATTVMAAVLPTFYSSVAAGNLAPNLASSYWGYSNTIAMIFIALSAPVLGAIADFRSSKLRFLKIFLVLGIFFTAALYLIQKGDWLAASAFYIVARIGFAGTNIFYDSLLPHVAPKDRIDQVSLLGYAVGYLGGGLLLALNLWFIMKPEMWGMADSAQAARVSFVSVAVWWGLFSIPLFRYVPEPPGSPSTNQHRNALVESFRRLSNTLRNMRRFRELFRFLLAFWLYNDGIGTIIVMAVIFGAEIGIGQSDLIGAILLVQFLGMPFSILFIKIAQKLSARNAIILGLAGYCLVSIGGFFLQNALHFWIMAVVVSMIQGGTQGLSRSVYGSMVPKQKSAEFFGFYDVSQKFSGILGPTIFGLVGQLMGNSRWGILALILFFISGILLLLKIDVSRGIAQAEARA